ncbi:MAG: UDP-N-acetylmuramate dehydrogenase [bacterium]|nr:UDP-N-acetylmuramate dehydrogenase [bacterium]MDA1024587.1 UDP-N-acetylmuramate dehydrogenase [bacterium]
MTFEEHLQSIFPGRLKTNELLGKHLNFRIGGPARFFAEVKTVEELVHAIQLCKEHEVEFFVLGGGSNTLASDEGFDGVVLKLAMRDIVINGTHLVADAGAISASVARKTADAGLAGFTWAISLPGTIGGAIRGNAGCFGGEMKDTVTKVEVYRVGQIVELTNRDLKFGYRDSWVKHSDDIVLRVYMELQKSNREELLAELKAIVEKRKASQPLYAGSAGCIFKNYEIDSVEELKRLKAYDVFPEAMLEARRISAGWVIDQLDLKGKQIGGAKVSDEHGNFVVNLGDATADDIVQLVALIKTKARNTFGIQLHEEIKYLGF